FIAVVLIVTFNLFVSESETFSQLCNDDVRTYPVSTFRNKFLQKDPPARKNQVFSQNSLPCPMNLRDFASLPFAVTPVRRRLARVWIRDNIVTPACAGGGLVLRHENDTQKQK